MIPLPKNWMQFVFLLFTKVSRLKNSSLSFITLSWRDKEVLVRNLNRRTTRTATAKFVICYSKFFSTTMSSLEQKKNFFILVWKTRCCVCGFFVFVFCFYVFQNYQVNWIARLLVCQFMSIPALSIRSCDRRSDCTILLVRLEDLPRHEKL